MERWEAIVESYPPAPTLRDFSKAVESAKVLLKEDLAPFEIDWLLQTLLSSPVNVLPILSTHYHDDAWSNVCGRCLELLLSLVTDHTVHVRDYMEDIVKRCTHQYSVHVRRRALQCLAGVAARAPACSIERAWPAVVDGLRADEAVTARVARAQLVGTICEHHPELLGREQEIEIWRVYLTILDASKTTDSLTNGVLLGLSGLFQHFGLNLPTCELNRFYDQLSAKYSLISTCQEACYQLLSRHAKLFPERLAADRPLRLRLWTAVAVADAGAADAAMAVYAVAVTGDNVQSIVTTEVYPRTVSQSPHERNTANRIMCSIFKRHTDSGLLDVKQAFDKQVSSTCTSLEFALAAKLNTAPPRDTWEYDHNLVTLVQQAAWCIESGLSGSDALLRTVLLLYPQLPPARRRELVADTVLNASDSLRTAAITFLVSDSCASPPPLRPALWRQLLDGGGRQGAADKTRAAFHDVIGYVLFVLRGCARGTLAGENARQVLSSLLLFASQIIQIEVVRDYLTEYVESLLCFTLDCCSRHGLSEGLVHFMAELVSVADEACLFEDGSLSDDLLEELKTFYQSLRIDRCRAEALMCASCLALTRAPEPAEDFATRLEALQVIFSRSDVEAATLCRTLRRFETALTHERSGEFQHLIEDIISKISSLNAKRDMSDRDGRILRRDLLIFLGKHDAKSNEAGTGDSGVDKLQDLLVLTLPNTRDGTVLKINLRRTLHLALIQEDPKALHVLMLILCTNLAAKSEPALQDALSRVIYKLARCHGRGESETDADSLEHAVSFCRSVECVRSFIEYITTERSPGVRKILSSLLESLLLIEAHSEATEQAARVVAERTDLMMASNSSITKCGGLDLVETTIAALKENDALTIEFVPNLLVSILRTDERGFEVAYDIASTHFLDKIVLFEDDALEDTAKRLLESVTVICDEVNLKPGIEVSLVTFKEISSSAKWDTAKKFLEMFARIFAEKPKDAMAEVKCLLLLSKAKEILDFDAETSRKVFSMNDFWLFEMVKHLLGRKGGIYSEVVFKTLGVYCEVSLEVKYVMTIEYLGQAIAKLSPKCVKEHHETIGGTLKMYQRHWKKTPQGVVNGFLAWWRKLPLQTITDNVETRTFVPKQATVVYAMKKLIDIVNLPDLPNLLLESQEQIKKWPTMLLHSFASSYSTDLFKSKMADMIDILTVSFHFLTADEVAEIILEGWQNKGMSNEKIGLKFCRYFVEAFAPYVLTRDILLREDMKCCAVLVHDLVKYCPKYSADEDSCAKVLDWVHKLWPTLAASQTFNELHNLLIDLEEMNASSLTLESNPGQWWLDTMTGCGEGQRAKLMTTLPVFLKDGVADACRERYLSSLLTYSDRTPRLAVSSAPEPHTLALLQAGAHAGDVTLLELLVACCSHDATPPWLDAALESAMAALATKQDAAVLSAVYTLCDRGQLSATLYERVLVPLIRHSSVAVCMEFFPLALSRALAALWKRPRVSPPPRAAVATLARAHTLAAVAFEKLPLSELQSPTSRLYEHLQLKRGATLAKELCSLCVALRTQVQCPADAAEELKDVVRWYQCANFNCLATVLCRTRPAAKFYTSILQPSVLAALVNTGKPCRLYIQPQGITASVQRFAAATDDDDAPLTCRHTALATRSLSDNPLAYDLLSTRLPEQTPPQTLILSDNELNAHPCAVALTIAVTQLSVLESKMTAVEALLYHDSLHNHAKWLVTQAVLNCRTELTNHAVYLTSALLCVIATTPFESQGKKLLNGLHVNALNTIAQWNAEAKEKPTVTQADKDHIQTIFDLLLAACIHHKSRLYVFKTCMSTLNGFLKLYGEFLHGKWEFFAEVLTDKSNEAACLDVLLAVARHGVYVPELLGQVLAKLESKQSLANKLSGTAELFGLALAASGGSDLNRILDRFWKALDRLRCSRQQDYVKVLFYAQSGSRQCCSEIHFRYIADLTPKMVREQKTKCFEIITAYVARVSHPNDYISDMFESVELCEAIATGDLRVHALKLAKSGLRLMNEGLKRRVTFLACEVCADSAAKVRGAALEVVLEAFREIFGRPCGEPPQKRPRTADTALLRVCSGEVWPRAVAAAAGRGLVDGGGRAALDAVAAVLNTDLATRFSEVLLLVVSLPAPGAAQSAPDVALTLTVTLRLLFHDLAGTDAFKRLKLREEPLESVSSHSSAPSKLLTMGRSYQGTFRATVSGTSGSRKTKVKPKQGASLNVQISLGDVLETFLGFTQRCAGVAEALFLDTVRGLQRMRRDELGGNAESTLNTAMASQLVDIVGKGQLDALTPVVLQLCRLCVRECCALDGFQPAVLKINTLTARTVGEGISSLLYEDVLMETGEGLAPFGADDDNDDDDEDVSAEPMEFSIEALERSFGSLSDWSQLTTRERRRAESALATPLWTDDVTFRAALDNYTVATDWLSKMQQSLGQRCAKEHYRWLRQLDRWPVNAFAVSAITEAIEWHSIVTEDDMKRLPCSIKSGDCLAEWAARFMMRSAYLSQLSLTSDSDSDWVRMRRRAQELAWSAEANKRRLPTVALQCVRRNAQELCESETLEWIHQQALALRSLAHDTRSDLMLRRALDKTETSAQEYRDHAPPHVVLSVDRLQLQLNQDLGSLTGEKIDAILDPFWGRKGALFTDKAYGTQNRGNLVSMCETAMCYYDKGWEQCSEVSDQGETLSQMVVLLRKAADLKCPASVEAFASIILLKVDQYGGEQLPCGLAEELLSTLESVSDYLTDFISQELCRLRGRFPSRAALCEPRALSESAPRLWLQLLCDPAHALRQYVEELAQCLNKGDEDGWGATYGRMERLLDNPHAGSAFQLLARHRAALDEIKHYEIFKDYQTTARQTLRAIHSQLSAQDDKVVLNLAQLCPALANYSFPGRDREGDILEKLLGLKDGVRVVRFERQVRVISGSLRRPCVLHVRTSDGRRRRHLAKRGEPLRVDAAAARAQAALCYRAAAAHTHYAVTPLSDDCALIEYLEDHVTLRSMIPQAAEILRTVRRPDDTELILASAASTLKQFEEICQRVPVGCLRWTIEESSLSVQDFLQKRSRFTESLAAITICTWILGVGDRHLDNLLYEPASGALVAIDWGSTLQHCLASRVPELAPARVTRTLLALAQPRAVHSRLEAMVWSLRAARGVILPAIRVLFRWMPDYSGDGLRKMNYIQDILGGKSLSCHITRAVLEDSVLPNVDKYLALLDTVFEAYPVKEEYDEQDQVRCLLQQCADHRILSVTRSGWEPWL